MNELQDLRPLLAYAEPAGTILEPMLEMLLFAGAITVGLLPTLIAFYRRGKNRMAILALNLLLGWILLAWIGALVWALTNPRSAMPDDEPAHAG